MTEKKIPRDFSRKKQEERKVKLLENENVSRADEEEKVESLIEDYLRGKLELSKN